MFKTGFAIITWNNPKKLEKPWITKGFFTWQSLGLIFSMVTVGASMVDTLKPPRKTTVWHEHRQTLPPQPQHERYRWTNYARDTMPISHHPTSDTSWHSRSHPARQSPAWGIGDPNWPILRFLFFLFKAKILKGFWRKNILNHLKFVSKMCLFKSNDFCWRGQICVMSLLNRCSEWH